MTSTRCLAIRIRAGITLLNRVPYSVPKMLNKDTAAMDRPRLISALVEAEYPLELRARGSIAVDQTLW